MSLAPVPDVLPLCKLPLSSASQPCNLDQPAWPHPLPPEGDKQVRENLPTFTACSPSSSPWKAKSSQDVASPLHRRKAYFWVWAGYKRGIKTNNSRRRESAKGFEERFRERRENIRRPAEKVVQENGIILDRKFRGLSSSRPQIFLTSDTYPSRSVSLEVSTWPCLCSLQPSELL